MKKFIKNLLIFLTVSLITSYALGVIIEKYIENNIKDNQFLLQEDWHIIHSDVNKILFIGNSRTWSQIDAEKISLQLGQKTYVLSQDGRDSRILFHKFKTYLARNIQPEKIFLQFDPYFINPLNDGTFYGKDNYLRYIYKDRLGINHLFENEKGYNKFETFIPLKRYFSTRNGIQILYNHITNKNQNNKSFRFGSEPQKFAWQNKSNFENPDVTTGQLKYDYIDSMIQLCNKMSIKITLIYPPQSYPSYLKVEPTILKSLKSFAQSRKIEFWNFNGMKYNNKNIFYNHMHLNDKGSLIYTNDLLDSIISYKTKH